MFKSILICLGAISCMLAAECFATGFYAYPAKISKDNCPAERPFYSERKKECFGCDSLTHIDIDIGHEKEFEICKNRQFEKGMYVNSFMSVLKECPAGFMKKHDDCVPCDEPHNIWVEEKQECDRCDNRTYHEQQKGGLCILKECPNDYPIKGQGGCWKCDERHVIFTSEEECSKCQDRQYEKFIGSDNMGCALNKEKLPLIELGNSWTSYPFGASQYLTSGYDCGVQREIETSEKNCKKCPNRKYIDGKCILVSQ